MENLYIDKNLVDLKVIKENQWLYGLNDKFPAYKWVIYFLINTIYDKKCIFLK